MKKALFFLFLFAIVASTSVQEYNEDDDVVLQGIRIHIDIKKEWNKVKKYTGQAIAFLKRIGLYPILVDAVKRYGTSYGINACVNKGFDKDICTALVQWAFSFIK